MLQKLPLCITVMQLESQCGDLLGNDHQRSDQQTQEEILLVKMREEKNLKVKCRSVRFHISVFVTRSFIRWRLVRVFFYNLHNRLFWMSETNVNVVGEGSVTSATIVRVYRDRDLFTPALWFHLHTKLSLTKNVSV